MPDSITCGRCGMTSRNPDDIAAVYCGHCHAVAAPYIRPGLPWDDPGADILGDIRASMQDYYDRPVRVDETVLTPEVLLTDGRWLFEGFRDGEALFRFSLLAGPWVASWLPDTSLGAFTADWTGGDSLQIRLRREVIERAAAELTGQIGVRRLTEPGCAALRAVLKAMHPVSPVLSEAADTWYCERCGRFMQAPPGQSLMLCGYHEPAERMGLIQLTDLHASVLSMAVQVREDEAPGIFQYQAHQALLDERIAATVLARPPTLAGLTVDAGTGLTEAQSRELDQQIRESYGIAPTAEREREGGSPAARRARRQAQESPADRRARVLSQAEKMIARLDGEGYGVRAKAEQVDQETVSIPELPLLDPRQGGNAARWHPGDPAL